MTPSIQTARYVRKPLHVNALQVTDENLETVAEWCGGVLGQDGKKKFIRLYLKFARTPRQTVAYSGDWITKVGSTFKVWTNKSFRETFEPASDNLFQKINSGMSESDREFSATHDDGL